MSLDSCPWLHRGSYAHLEGGDMDAGGRGQLVDGVHRRMFWIGWLANAVGAAVVTLALGFLIPIFFADIDAHALLLENLPFMVPYFIVAGMVVMTLADRNHDKAVAWIREGREPTPAEHRLTLQLCSRSVLITAGCWAVGGTMFGLLNLDHGVGFAILCAATIWLGGETTSALEYLLSERGARPVTALALAARLPSRPVGLGVRDRLLAAWSLGTGVPITGVLAVGIVGVANDGVETRYVAAAGLFLGAVALVVGLLATILAAKAIADPVTSVRAALDRVAGGDLDTHVRIDDGSEVGLLQAGFNRMAEGMRERERIRDMFGRQVGHDVARAALRDGARLYGEEREIGALFIDITGSTSMALAMPPTEVVAVLNRFFRVVVDVVESEQGLVNKFEGDAALCVFGAPVACGDPAGSALRAARTLAARLDRELPEIGFGIGVSAGRAVAGNVGSERRFEYTVIGDPVNEAARLCDLAKQRGEAVIASESALHRSADGEDESWAVTDRTVLRGRLDATGLALPRG